MQAKNRIPQQTAVEVKADAFNEAVLLHAEKISRTAYLQVLHGNFKARAQFLIFFYCLEPLLDSSGQGYKLVYNQIAEGAPGKPPYPTTQLIKIRQAEHIGSVNEDCIGVRYIYSGLDNGS